MKYLSLILLTSIVLLSSVRSTNGLSYIAGEGTVAVVDLGTGLHTSTTLSWHGTGAIKFYTINISRNPPSSMAKLTNAATFNVAAWKTSCVINGLAPGTYYVAVQAVNHFGYSPCTIQRIVIPSHRSS